MKEIIGQIISDKMNSSAIVLIERSYRHPLYGKIIRLKKKLHASNKIGAKTGQMVKLVSTKPVSKTISFNISEILTTAKKGPESKGNNLKKTTGKKAK